MLRIFLISFFTLLSISLFAQDIVMNSNEIQTFKEQVKAVSENTSSITSDFVQYKHLDFLENDIETFGKLTFKAPGLVKWEYTDPYQYSVIFKEDMLLVNDGGTKSNVEIGNSKLFKKLNEVIVASVKGDMFDAAEFEISYFKNNRINKAIFSPKDKKLARYIASVELSFDKVDGTVLEVKMIEPSSDFTRIIFSNRVQNIEVDDAVFTN